MQDLSSLGLFPIFYKNFFRLLGGNALELCLYNLEQATKTQRKDLIKVWKLLEQCVRGANQKFGIFEQNRIYFLGGFRQKITQK